MAPQLGYLPTRIVAGETIWIAAANTDQSQTDITLDDYSPADSDVLAFQFAAPIPISVSAVANGGNTGWTLTVTAAQTLLWTARVVSFAGMVTASERVFAVDGGVIEMTPSPLRVSQYATALAAIETAISNFATSPERAFTLGDMQVTYGTVDELLQLRAFYKGEVAKETNRPKRRIRTRFT